jgi:peptidyl-prolyl cis-trans isomerase A (cyclophilin A)
MRPILIVFIFFISLSSHAEENALFAFATLKTSMGDIRIRLFKKEAPRYVDNFVNLATGRRGFRDPKTGKKVKDIPFYKDMIFHKVHPDLGIQTGCPWGNGKGWPGYNIKEEKNELKFDRAYLVGMSTILGDSNSVGSQFFITTKPAPHLEKAHTVMGEVIEGQSVVRTISRQKRDAMMKPLEPIQLLELVIDGE